MPLAEDHRGLAGLVIGFAVWSTIKGANVVKQKGPEGKRA